MSAFKFCLPLMMATTLVLGARAADDAKPATPATPAAPAAKDDADKGEKKGKKDGFTGMLSEKPADAKEGVVAVLTTKKGDKHNLIASGETAKQIAELIKKGVKTRVAGEQSPEGVKVTKVSEVIPGEKKKKKD